jgi:8-oxo-dGTP pyrophosphatase MutT (NUDIX family)
MIRRWPLLKSETVFNPALFRVSRDRTRSPRTGGEQDFHVIHMADWLLVVPITTDGKLVMVRQYRHGSREIGLEIPGGLLDDSDARPVQGAARELMEETGYCSSAENLSLLGKLWPQPALLSNQLWIYLAQNVRPVAMPNPDEGEDIEIVLLEPHEMTTLIANGGISNAMTVSALMLARLNGYLDPLEAREFSDKEKEQ